MPNAQSAGRPQKQLTWIGPNYAVLVLRTDQRTNKAKPAPISSEVWTDQRTERPKYGHMTYYSNMFPAGRSRGICQGR